MSDYDYSYLAQKGLNLASINIDDGQIWLNNGYDIYRKIFEDDVENYISDLEKEYVPEVEEESSEQVVPSDNIFERAEDEDGEPYNNGKWCKDGYTIDEDGLESVCQGIKISGYMPAQKNDFVIFNGFGFDFENGEHKIAFYDSDKELIKVLSVEEWIDSGDLDPFTLTEDKNVRSFRITSIRDYVETEVWPEDIEGEDDEEIEPLDEGDSDVIVDVPQDGVITDNEDDYEDGDDEYIEDEEEEEVEPIIETEEVDFTDTVAFIRISFSSVGASIYVDHEQINETENAPLEGEEKVNLIEEGWELFARAGDQMPMLFVGEDGNEDILLSGLYIYKDPPNGDSAVYYMKNHGDDPKKDENGDILRTETGNIAGFPESDLVWRFGAEELGISTDHGESYPYKLQVDGDAILRNINAKSEIAIGPSVKNKEDGNGFDYSKGRAVVINNESIRLLNNNNSVFEAVISHEFVQAQAESRVFEGAAEYHATDTEGEYMLMSPTGVRLEANKMYFWRVKSVASAWGDGGSAPSVDSGYRVFISPVTMTTNTTTRYLVFRTSNGSVVEVNNGSSAYIQLCGYYNPSAMAEVNISGRLSIDCSNNIQGGLSSGIAPLTIGKENGQHLAFDNNEIMSKSNATTPSALHLNKNGGQVAINTNGDYPIRFRNGNIDLGTGNEFGTVWNNHYLCYDMGDSFTVEWVGSGYLSNSRRDVRFFLPLCKPVSPNVFGVTVANNSGFILRQNGYTHGTDSNVYVKASSITSELREGGIYISASFTADANTQNNQVIGIQASIRVTFN